jgi:hypothetical protein
MDANDLGMYPEVVENAEIRLHRAHPEWSTADGFDFPANYQDLLDEEVTSRLDELADKDTWGYCLETKMEWDAEVRKHMGADGNNDVCTLSKIAESATDKFSRSCVDTLGSRLSSCTKTWMLLLSHI